MYNIETPVVRGHHFSFHEQLSRGHSFSTYARRGEGGQANAYECVQGGGGVDT